ncbi:MAG: dolichol kinase [Ignavibacteriae bacterium]|nr:dolichol kinase [Ignavibacteriota bacterium]
MEDKNQQIGLKNELLRKAIHLSSVVIPISYYFLEKNFLLAIVGAGTAFMILLDLARKLNPVINDFYVKVMGFVLRKHETDVKKHFFTGGTFYAIGFFLTLLLFKKEIAAPALMIMIISDTLAALVGKFYGKHSLWNKTFEGSIAFFISGAVIIFLTPKVTADFTEYIFAMFALLAVTAIEALPWELDDNVMIPVSFGIIYTILLYFI